MLINRAGPDCPNALQAGADVAHDPDLVLCLSTLQTLAGRSPSAQKYIDMYRPIVAHLCEILGTTPWNRFASHRDPMADDGQTMALVAESAGLPTIGGWEMDQHALIMMDELMTVTNSFPE